MNVLMKLNRSLITFFFLFKYKKKNTYHLYKKNITNSSFANYRRNVDLMSGGRAMDRIYLS